jgi:hypothetical protein
MDTIRRFFILAIVSASISSAYYINNFSTTGGLPTLKIRTMTSGYENFVLQIQVNNLMVL